MFGNSGAATFFEEYFQLHCNNPGRVIALCLTHHGFYQELEMMKTSSSCQIQKDWSQKSSFEKTEHEFQRAEYMILVLQ